MDEVLKELAVIHRARRTSKKVDGYWFTATYLDPVAMAKAMLKNQFRLSTASAIERTDNETDIVYHL